MARVAQIRYTIYYADNIIHQVTGPTSLLRVPNDFHIFQNMYYVARVVRTRVFILFRKSTEDAASILKHRLGKAPTTALEALTPILYVWVHGNIYRLSGHCYTRKTHVTQRLSIKTNRPFHSLRVFQWTRASGIISIPSRIM